MDKQLQQVYQDYLLEELFKAMQENDHDKKKILNRATKTFKGIK